MAASPAVEPLPLLRPCVLRASTVPVPGRLFEPPHPPAIKAIAALYRKYHHELAPLASALQGTYQAMRRQGQGAMFGDVEGELLYMLVREARPRRVYEISPCCGYSSNYLLAAVTRNGAGEVHGFELRSTVGEVPLRLVLEENLVEACDRSRYRLHVGDARHTVTERLLAERPDFVLLDSRHDDVFAEFYVKVLLPRVRGPVVIQDICHFDPRPEDSSESLYVLSFLQESGSRFLPVGACEHVLGEGRPALAPRRPMRSSSIAVWSPGDALREPGWRARAEAMLRIQQGAPAPADLAMFPVHAAREHKRAAPPPAPGDAPEDAYARALLHSAAAGRGGEPRNSLPWLLALGSPRGRPGVVDAAGIERGFSGWDPWFQMLAVRVLDRHGHADLADRLLRSQERSELRGGELPLQRARRALARGRRGEALDLLRQAVQQARDPSLAVGYRLLLGCAEALRDAGAPDEAEGAFGSSLAVLAARSPPDRAKGVPEVLGFALRHPKLLREAIRATRPLDGADVLAAARHAALGSGRRRLAPLRRPG